MATITKRELSIRITERIGVNGTGITRQAIPEIVQTLIDEITDALARGDNVVMRKFGTLKCGR